MKTHTALSFLALAFAVSASAADGPKGIQLNCKIISVPMDAPVLREAGLTLDSSAESSNLGTISAEKAAALFAKLEKTPGFSLFSAPSIVSKSGQQASTESVREFVYPTKFDPPKLSSGTDAKPVQLAPGQVVAASPASPADFQMRPIGVRIEEECTLGADGTMIDVNLFAELTTFEGFVNYGSPIKAVAADKDGKLQETVLTENQIQQRVFHTVKHKLSTTITSGHCLVLGGQGASTGPLSATGQKPDLTQAANPGQRPANAIFFFIQAKVFDP